MSLQNIGPYEVLSILGDGGMGTVYKGRDPRFDRAVAIKVLHPQFQRDPEIVERFKSEAVIQAKLNHPNIVTVFDFIATNDTLAMVMEYVEGKPLDQVIDECHGPMDPARVVELMRQILSAMGYAHEQGLVHRDIKPSNIAIQRVGDEEIAKVMDFGIAKILGSEKLKTATGAKMGTLAYMSPEQIKSPKYVDARSDIYSLGVVLYEMLSGRVPFDSDSEYELMRQIVSESVRPILDGSLQIPSSLRRAVERAVAKEPDDRFPSCAEFRQALLSDGITSPGSSRARVPPPLAATTTPRSVATSSDLQAATYEAATALDSRPLTLPLLAGVNEAGFDSRRFSVFLFALIATTWATNLVTFVLPYNWDESRFRDWVSFIASPISLAVGTLLGYRFLSGSAPLVGASVVFGILTAFAGYIRGSDVSMVMVGVLNGLRALVLLFALTVAFERIPRRTLALGLGLAIGTALVDILGVVFSRALMMGDWNVLRWLGVSLQSLLRPADWVIWGLKGLVFSLATVHGERLLLRPEAFARPSSR